MNVCGLKIVFLVGWTLLCKDLLSAFQDRSVFYVDDATVRAWFEVEFHHFAVFVLVRSKVIAHRLFINIEFLGDFGHTTARQSVFDATELLKGDIHKQNV